MLFLKVWNPFQSFPSPFNAVSSVTNKLHFVSYMCFFMLGIYDRIKTDKINIATENNNNQNNVYLIYFLVYGLINVSRLVHCQGGQLLENRHQSMTKLIIIQNRTMTIIYGTKSDLA